MKKTLNLLVIMLMTASALMAQDKKSFTLEDLLPGGNNYSNLQPKNIHGLSWWGDICLEGDIAELRMFNPTNGKRSVLTTLKKSKRFACNQEFGQNPPLL